MASEISIELDESWKDTDKISWADYNFRQMPMLATMPIFEKIKNDVKSAESSMLNYLMNKVGGEEIVFDNYQVVMQSRSEEHTSELQSRGQLVCRLLLEKKNRLNLVL